MNNPIFLVIGIAIFWIVSSIAIGGIYEKKKKATKAASQAKAIARLYPEGDPFT